MTKVLRVDLLEHLANFDVAFHQVSNYSSELCKIDLAIEVLKSETFVAGVDIKSGHLLKGYDNTLTAQDFFAVGFENFNVLTERSKPIACELVNIKIGASLPIVKTELRLFLCVIVEYFFDDIFNSF